MPAEMLLIIRPIHRVPEVAALAESEEMAAQLDRVRLKMELASEGLVKRRQSQETLLCMPEEVEVALGLAALGWAGRELVEMEEQAVPLMAVMDRTTQVLEGAVHTGREQEVLEARAL
jgi:hypothetical protein